MCQGRDQLNEMRPAMDELGRAVPLVSSALPQVWQGAPPVELMQAGMRHCASNPTPLQWIHMTAVHFEVRRVHCLQVFIWWST